MGEPQTYFLETLGCPKNQVDSDKLEGRFAADGMTPVDSPDEADIVVVLQGQNVPVQLRSPGTIGGES